MKRKWFISSLILGLFLSLSLVSSQQQSHPAGEIEAGSFQTGGAYIFPESVGIIKTTPGRPLHIKADSSDRNIRLEETGTGVEYFDIGIDTSGDLNIWRDGDSTTPTLSILDATGRVGIGTETPLEQLDVSGAIRMDTTSSNNAGTIKWTGTDFEGNLDGTSTGWVSLTAGGGGYWIRSDSKLYPNSDTWYVGIGGEPSTKLTVNETTDNYAVIAIDSGSISSQYSAIDFYDRGINEWGIGKDPNNEFYISEFGEAIRLKIEPGGEVGIGTENPDYKLDVNGALRLRPISSATGANGVIYYDQEDGKFRCYENGAWTDCIGAGGADNDWAAVGGGDPTLAGEIYHTGNVGIGLNDPTQRLDVAGNAYVQRLLVKTNTVSTTSDISLIDNAMIEATQNMYFSMDSDNNQIDRAFIFGHNSDDTTGFAELMRIEEDGDLDVSNDIYSSDGALIRSDGWDGSDPWDAGIYSNTNGQWVRFVTNNADFGWFSDGATGTADGLIMRLKPNGDLNVTGDLMVGGNYKASGCRKYQTISSVIFDVSFCRNNNPCQLILYDQTDNQMSYGTLIQEDGYWLSFYLNTELAQGSRDQKWWGTNGDINPEEVIGSWDCEVYDDACGEMSSDQMCLRVQTGQTATCHLTICSTTGPFP